MNIFSSNTLSKQEAIDGLLVLEKLYLTLTQMGAPSELQKEVEKKISKLLDLI